MAGLSLKAMKLRWRFIILGLVVVALLTASYQLVEKYLAQQSQALEQRINAEMEWVLVFSQDLDAGSVIGLEHLQQRKFPPAYISDDWLRPNDAMAVVGNSVENFVSAGEPVILGHLGKVRRSSFSDKIAPGEYAVTATVGIEQVHHGLLAVGNRVTLVAGGFGGSALRMLTDIEVLALDRQQSDAAGAQLAVTATFRLRAEQAIEFEQLRQSGFALWLQHPEAEYPVLNETPPPLLFVISKQGAH
ncbi:Flp pilus assembly protein CpaB [Pseudidiomarina sp.]|uniref:Flp pilus assembly protein CpaB n=1 Tax=Pseudidiomarina sp. TaxID=2081707 RepID=UPI003A986F6A